MFRNRYTFQTTCSSLGDEMQHSISDAKLQNNGNKSQNVNDIPPLNSQNGSDRQQFSHFKCDFNLHCVQEIENLTSLAKKSPETAFKVQVPDIGRDNTPDPTRHLATII